MHRILKSAVIAALSFSFVACASKPKEDSAPAQAVSADEAPAMDQASTPVAHDHSAETIAPTEETVAPAKTEKKSKIAKKSRSKTRKKNRNK